MFTEEQIERLALLIKHVRLRYDSENADDQLLPKFFVLHAKELWNGKQLKSAVPSIKLSGTGCNADELLFDVLMNLNAIAPYRWDMSDTITFSFWREEEEYKEKKGGTVNGLGPEVLLVLWKCPLSENHNIPSTRGRELTSPSFGSRQSPIM